MKTETVPLSGQRAAIVARLAARAFKAAALDEPTAGMMRMLQVADRTFEVRYGMSSADQAVEHHILVVADDWSCMVRKRVTEFVSDRRGVLRRLDCDLVLDVHFIGDWQACERDAIVVALA